MEHVVPRRSILCVVHLVGDKYGRFQGTRQGSKGVRCSVWDDRFKFVVVLLLFMKDPWGQYLGRK